MTTSAGSRAAPARSKSWNAGWRRQNPNQMRYGKRKSTIRLFSTKSQNPGTGAIWHRSLDLERGTLLTFFSFLSLLPPNSGPSGNACCRRRRRTMGAASAAAEADDEMARRGASRPSAAGTRVTSVGQSATWVAQQKNLRRIFDLKFITSTPESQALCKKLPPSFDNVSADESTNRELYQQWAGEKKTQWRATMVNSSRVAEWRSREWWLGKCPSEAVTFGHEGTRRTRAGAGQRERRQGAPKARLLTPAPHTVLSPASFAAQDALPLKPQDRAQAEEAKRRARARIGCISWGHRSAPNQ